MCIPGLIFPDLEKAPVEYIQVYHSHPQWIVKKWLKEFGSMKDVEAPCSANNSEPPLTIRVNPLKADIGSFKKALDEEGYSSSRTGLSPFGLAVDKKVDIFKTRTFQKGLFEVQDEGSQLVTLLAGAKSLFLSGLMKNRGTIIASDPSPVKIRNLRKRAGQAGAFNIKTTDALNEYDNMADCVFIDAPCSGMGVFRGCHDEKL